MSNKTKAVSETSSKVIINMQIAENVLNKSDLEALKHIIKLLK